MEFSQLLASGIIGFAVGIIVGRYITVRGNWLSKPDEKRLLGEYRKLDATQQERLQVNIEPFLKEANEKNQAKRQLDEEKYWHGRK